MKDKLSKDEFLAKIIKLASENPEFKQKLVENPKEVFEKIVDFKFPEDFEIAVHQDTQRTLNIVLPDTTDELSEVELAAVSGGVCWDDSCTYSGCCP